MDAQREWFEKDYYAMLDVAADASHKDITKAYRKLARQLHPDQNPGDAKSEDRFKEVSAAYDVLGDEEKRKQYDEVRRMGPMAGGGGPGGLLVQCRRHAGRRHQRPAGADVPWPAERRRAIPVECRPAARLPMSRPNSISNSPTQPPV